jgi:hypothetical protein
MAFEPNPPPVPMPLCENCGVNAMFWRACYERVRKPFSYSSTFNAPLMAS